MLACNCELAEEYCENCFVMRRHQSKRQTPETHFMRLVNGKALPYEEAMKYFTGDENAIAKSLEICFRE